MAKGIAMDIVGSIFFIFIGLVLILWRDAVTRSSVFWRAEDSPKELRTPVKVTVFFGALAIFLGTVKLLLIAYDFMVRILT
ncbi:MAG TPA: hypothetical protein VF543_16280 [Pyrinomonadaceae bacterium]|jgi:hypothetical protein